jgi:hypothetical protein
VIETCANCEEPIGKLEPAMLWNGRVICARCHQRLSPPVEPIAYAAVAAAPPGSPPQTGNIQTIQLTAKRFKLQLLIAAPLAIVATLIGSVGFAAGSTAIGALGITIAVAAFAWAVIIRGLIWWHHG